MKECNWGVTALTTVVGCQNATRFSSLPFSGDREPEGKANKKEGFITANYPHKLKYNKCKREGPGMIAIRW